MQQLVCCISDEAVSLGLGVKKLLILTCISLFGLCQYPVKYFLWRVPISEWKAYEQRMTRAVQIIKSFVTNL